jgi:hypothetical protein
MKNLPRLGITSSRITAQKKKASHQTKSFLLHMQANSITQFVKKSLKRAK